MHKHFSAQLDEDHRIKVNAFLQIEGHSNIFAAGDVTFFKEEKLVERAVKQAEVVAENITRLTKGQPLRAQYSSQQKPGKITFFFCLISHADHLFIGAQVLSIGPAQGVFMMWGGVVCCGETPALMKKFFLENHIKRLLACIISFMTYNSEI